MPTEKEVEAAAQVLWNMQHAKYGGSWGARQSNEVVIIETRAIAKEALIAAEVERVAETRRTCKHPRKIGTGTLSSDGASEHSWYCPECGMSESHKTPAQAIPDPVRRW